VQGKAPWVLRRDQAYLAVMADDLISKGVSEPYRMFTSRAEFRLQLREDNADRRLTEVGRELGLVDDERWAHFCRKLEAVSRETERLRSTWVNPRTLGAEDATAVLGKPIEHEYSLADLLRRPEVRYDTLDRICALLPNEGDVPRETARSEEDRTLAEAVREQVEIGIKYAGYIEKQIEEVERAAAFDDMALPADLDYSRVHALGFEVRQKLSLHRPETLGQAGRISGVTPAAISLLLVHLKKRRLKSVAGAEA
jgi:tRNA uridine 5-carboxymethylaminomethyl modification enzyme